MIYHWKNMSITGRDFQLSQYLVMDNFTFERNVSDPRTPDG